MVSKLKWLEPRHMINVCDRWARDKTDNLQAAFFNGVGYESWENIWGIWNQITPRDAEALRRVARIERQFADLLVSRDWEPHTPTLQYGVFASRFPGQGRTLWTLVNRNEYDVAGEQIEIPHPEGARYYDLWSGTELTPRVAGGKAELSFPMEERGFGAILEILPGAAPPTLDAPPRVRLASLSHEWTFLPQQMTEIAPAKVSGAPPAGMVRIPAGDFLFQVTGIEIEGFNWIGVDVQYPWEDAPRRGHRHLLAMKPFYIDRYPATNAEFKKFLDAAGYRPKDDHNFLKDWRNGTFPEGWADKPVTWVSLEDARAYAAWAGRRLPHEWEWQYAAQGADGRLYPWGNSWDERAAPPPYQGRDLLGPADVKAHPAGASPFGVMDMVGNVWQWTDEFVDEHTRAAILRGGSYYRPQGSMWYFPQAYRLTEHGKYLLMAPSKDRAGTLGFRCVMDE
jgi:formylglycine-generating enzyme required for sulfatase activity